MADWYPQATKTSGSDAGIFLTGYTKRGVLHTTQGGTVTGAISAYKRSNSWPHFTVGQDGKVHQHIPISKAARALQNLSGGVETNRAGAIQIEVVGFAAVTVWPQVQVEAVRALMRWIEAQTGIQPIGVKQGGPEQYGLHNPLEFTNEQWKTYNGWCGHQNVPENLHWDPGAIDIYTLLPITEIKPMFNPPLDLEPIAAYVLQNGGFYQGASSGALYAFGAPPIRGANGQPWFAGRVLAELYRSDDSTVPEHLRVPGGVAIRTTSNEWYIRLP